MRGPFARWPHLADTMLGVVVFLCNIFVSDDDQDLIIRAVGELPVAATLLLALASGALYWRRRHPLTVLGLILMVMAVLSGLGYFYSVWALPFALYAVGYYANNIRWSRVGVGATIMFVMIISLIQKEPAGNIGFFFVLLFLIWYFGRYIRVRGDYLRLLEQRAIHLEREHDSEARRAVADERTRIARELHDIVAHQVSLMTVQAGAAKTVAAKDPQSALQAMEAVETAGRQALDELRHLMGVLRPDSQASVLGPQPGIADIPRLVEQLREAGLDVSHTMEGEWNNLPARVALSTYRIVQESMTNVLKHAGAGVQAEIRLSADSHEVAIEVIDNGHGADLLTYCGHGIIGMRERAQLLGGHLEAGPRQNGGFQVVAHLPIGEHLL